MTRLRYLLSPTDRRCGDHGSPEDLLSVSIHRGVVPRLHETQDLPRAVDLAGYKLVRRGDIVLNRMRAFQGAVGKAPCDGIVSPDYIVLMPGSEVEAAYLHHLFRSPWFVAEMVARLRGIGSTDTGSVRTPRINWDDLGDIEVSVPDRHEQRAIADYLDAETARIDALIAKKQQLIHLLEERLWADVVREVAGCRRFVPLRRALASIVDGPFGSALTSAHYVTEPETRVVRLGNIGFAEFRGHDEAYVSHSYGTELRRHRVTRGDLLIAGLGDSRNHVGRAVVAPDLGKAIVKADCYCAAVDQRVAIPEFLAVVLSSPLGRDAVGKAGRGTTRSRINLEIAKEVVLPLPELFVQRSIAARFEERRVASNRSKEAVSTQVALLAEKRQALITAAVTGEFSVPGAA